MNEALVARIASDLLARREWLAVAESCTGGLIAAACTDLAGSSGWFERGLVTYSNRAKQELLGVPAGLLETHGAVSEPCVRAMAEGLMARAPVRHVIAISGIAGPGGGSADKPVGTVWIAWAGAGSLRTALYRFAGDRQSVRQQAAEAALRGLIEQLALSP
ncbi:MAG: CinA family protein [Pseudomonadota bacterium]